ncbi:MAG: bifunctional folylpolyglutamate synthase/dihydrofolate synthase [Candidatus Omnitrophica bacterium]|jgi:dihydrofolate synthase/folylpolyglutamate synthase|nr:bifunctional folylpolyglutamate synthase/dihydrofolate synthase [Candidatus Omnitrophota bacterium]
MDLTQSLRYLDSLANFEKFTEYDYSKAYDLKRISRLLSLLDNPEKRYPTITVSGTKGKGSTVSMLASIFNSAGIKAGALISPHLVCVNERIKVGERHISDSEFSSEISAIRDIAARHHLPDLTYFEVITAAAFSYFSRKKVEIAVLEVGLGGRLDAVNTARSPISAIMPVSYDHTRLLGTSLKDIAGEKCGIIHENSCVVCARQPAEVLPVVKRVVLRRRARLILAGRDIVVSNAKTSLSGTDFDLKTKSGFYKKLHSPLRGIHQSENAAVAVSLAETAGQRFNLPISKDVVRRGLAAADFPARFQLGLFRHRRVVLDGAQNVVSANALKKALNDIFDKRHICLILGVSSDKDYHKIVRILCPVSRSVIFTQADTPRALPADNLARAAGAYSKKGFVCYDLKDALTMAAAITPEKGVIVITGSLFLAAGALRILDGRH